MLSQEEQDDFSARRAASRAKEADSTGGDKAIAAVLPHFVDLSSDDESDKDDRHAEHQQSTSVWDDEDLAGQRR